MELILRDEIVNLGKRGDLVKVADGYARNFLLPRRLAVAATAGNKKIVEQEGQAHLRREAKETGEAQGLAKLLNGVSVTIAQKSGETEQLFGSVTVKDIADALQKQDFTIERRKIHLEAPIKQLGQYKIEVRLYKDVTAEIEVNVIKEEE